MPSQSRYGDAEEFKLRVVVPLPGGGPGAPRLLQALRCPTRSGR
jgi:hypothetical protein